MPALPFPLWSKDILTGIANTIGRFVALEKYFPTSFDKRTARVLVELDVSRGLLPEIEINCNSVVITQKLDYLKMSFRCSYCHETGHLRKSCCFLLQGISLIVGFTDSEPLLVSSPSSSSHLQNPLDTQPLIEPLTNSPAPPTLIGPYDSSSPTSVGDLTKGELLFIKDVESLALTASRSRIDQAVVSSPLSFNLEHFPPLHHPSSPTYASPG